LQFPQATEEWKEIAAEFKNHWQFNNCGGVEHGKHVRTVPPPNSRALYYNYKNFYSIILMALVSANYKFIYVDAEKQGRMSEARVLEYTSFSDRLMPEKLHFQTNDEKDEDLNFAIMSRKLHLIEIIAEPIK
jgi:hypothetical protein